MLTLFSVPKPFAGHVGTIQRNALRSWSSLSGVQVVLAGSEDWIAGAAAEADVEHVGGIPPSESGTPRLDDAFARVEAIARTRLRCFVNSDIVLLDDFLPAVRAVAAAARPFLLIGQTTDLVVETNLELGDRSVRDALAARARIEGRRRGATAIDYFVFTPGLFDPIPSFVVGRAGFDNWLVWRARTRGVVVDASRTVLAVHQHHEYGHVTGGHDEAHFGVEAARNRELAGGKRHLYTICDASHKLGADERLRRNLGATFRLRENARKAAWKLRQR